MPHAHIELHQGKTRVWNATGEEPAGLASLQLVDSADRDWVGDWALPPSQQGLLVLGTPLGHPAFTAQMLQARRDKEDLLLRRIPE